MKDTEDKEKQKAAERLLKLLEQAEEVSPKDDKKNLIAHVKAKYGR